MSILIQYAIYALIFYGGYRLLRYHVYRKGGALPDLHPEAYLKRHNPEALNALQEYRIQQKWHQIKTDGNATAGWNPLLWAWRYLRSLDEDTLVIGRKPNRLNNNVNSVDHSSTDSQSNESGPNRDALPVLICCGDSLTHGTCSFDYPKWVEQKSGDSLLVVNAGINGDLAWNLLQRLDAVVACKPEYVSILIGTNDVNATLSDALLRSYRRSKNLPVDVNPDQNWYIENLRTIISRLQSETDAKLSVFTIPLIGECEDDTVNRKVIAYNQALRDLCAEMRVTVLELHDAHVRLLREAREDSGENHAATDQKSDTVKAPIKPVCYDERRVEWQIEAAPWYRFILLWDWNRIGKRYGYLTLIDGVHLNDRGGRLAGELLLNWLNRP